MRTILVLGLIFCLVAVAFASYDYEDDEYDSKYRSYDGSGNNKRNPNWGKTDSAKLRKINKYEDGVSVPYGGEPSTLPSPRLISNLIFANRIPSLLAPKTTNVLTFFGQFIDHDIALTDIQPVETCERFDIPIPKGDIFFDPNNEGGKQMCFCKSFSVPGTGTGPTNPREFPNQDTGYLDLSDLYGSTEKDAKALRAFKGGLLKASKGPDGELLPYNKDENGNPLVNMANGGPLTQQQLFAAADPRANEHSLLMSYHTLWLREHNRRARTLPKHWSDEKKYQVARKWTIAHFEHIIFTEYLPALLGVPFPEYKGYNRSVESQTDLFFATAFMRMGHDQISTVQDRLQLNGRVIPQGNILLRDTYFKPDTVASIGIGPYFRGAVTTYQQKMDSLVVDDVRNFVYSQGPPTTDLIARNIQRAREFGLGSFNDAREALGLRRYTKYSDITSEPQAIEALEIAYGPHGIDLVDIFVGCLLETKLPNSLHGETLFTGFVDQFSRYRSGDRFWYQNRQFTRKQLKEIKETTFGDIIARNTDSVNIPRYPFFKDQRSSTQILDPDYHEEPERPQHDNENEYYERFARDAPSLGKTTKN